MAFIGGDRVGPPFLFPSLADIPEGELVDRLLGDEHWRGRILGLHGVPKNIVPRSRIPLNGFSPDLEGDVDILLIPPSQPELSVAIEVKRVKVAASAFIGGRPNKLNEIDKAYKQANRLAETGFSQVYCFLFVVVDSRFNNNGRFVYDGLTPPLRQLIDTAIRTEGLNDRVGLVRFEFVQPIDDEPLGAGTYGGHIKRLAVPFAQPEAVTNWINHLIE